MATSSSVREEWGRKEWDGGGKNGRVYVAEQRECVRVWGGYVAEQMGEERIGGCMLRVCMWLISEGRKGVYILQRKVCMLQRG